jgi:hypothetical protein
MTPYLSRLLEMSLNNVTIPGDWKAATVVRITKGVIDRQSNCRPIRVTSVVCNQLEHVIAGYLGQGWEKNDWLYEG